MMWSDALGCKIQQSGLSGAYTYTVAADRANRPVNFVNWGDAARFANWLHNGQPTGVQDETTTEDGSYNMSGTHGKSGNPLDTALLAVVRGADATWVIPSEDEWYKAAFHKNDGDTGNYFDYPTSSDTRPSNDIVDPDPGNNATFYFPYDRTIGSPYYNTEVGTHENSDSPYGTFDQGGSLWEWNETVHNYGSYRCWRGGSFDSYAHGSVQSYLGAWTRSEQLPSVHGSTSGFRLAEVPGPLVVEFDNQAVSDNNWSTRANWDDQPDPGRLIPASITNVTIGNGHTVHVVAPGQIAKTVNIIDAAMLNIGSGDLTVFQGVSVGPTATLNVYNTLTAQTVTSSGAIMLGANATVDATVTVTGGSFSAGDGVTIDSLEVSEGQVTLGSGTVGTINISGGMIALDGNVSAPAAVLSGGIVNTQGSALIISDSLEFESQELTVTTDAKFRIAGSDLMNPGTGSERTLTLLGGTTTIVRPIAPPGALAYWSFDGVMGSTVVNGGSLGAGANGALNGDAEMVTGGIGGTDALRLHGAGYMEVLNGIAGLGDSDASTISLWVKTTDVAGTFLRKCDGDDTWEWYESNYYLREGQMTAQRVGGSTGVVRGSTIVTDGQWHHMVLINDFGTKTIYVDDGAPDTLNDAYFNKDNDGDDTVVRIGWTVDVSIVNSFEGLIDEFRIYDRALTEAEVQELYSDGESVTNSEITLPHTNIAVPVNSTLAFDTDRTVTLGGVSLDNDVRLGISSGFDVHLTNLTLGDGSTLAADDRDMEISVSGTLSSVGSVGSLGGVAEAYEVSLTLESGARYEWEFEKTGGVVSADLVVVNGDLTLGNDWVLALLPAAGSELFDGTEQVGLFSYTGTLTGDLGNVLFEAPADWIVDNAVLREEINSFGTGINYVYMTGLETVPEPATLTLLALGGLAIFRRRRKY
jgi:hypothetical protein